MRRAIITTVGTSLLTSWDRIAGKPGILPNQSALLAAITELSLNSAEIASLTMLQLDKQYDYIYLLTSDTEQGILCAEVIRDYLTGHGFLYVEVGPIKGLNKNYHDFQTRGLPNLFEKMTEIHIQHSGSKMMINATGGFKAQTSYATFFGIMSGLEVVYMHEDFTSLLVFPPMPVSCDASFILQYKEQFGQITGVATKKEARRLIDELPLPLRGFFKKDGEGYGLSPIGKFFLANLERLTVSRQYTIRTHKNHTSLWGDGIQSIDKIKDGKVRELFMKIFDTVPYVTSIYLDEMIHRSTNDEPHMEYVETLNQALRYLVFTTQGAQYVKVEVLPGMEKETLRLLGKKIYG